MNIVINVESEIDKIFDILFPHVTDWDEIILTRCIENEYIKMVEPLIIKEKDRILFNICVISYLRKKCFFDIYYDYNDTLNTLKKATIDLINILNER